MATKAKISDQVLNVRLGAIYRVGAAKRLPRTDVEAILSDRCGFDTAKAAQLAAHWFSTEPYRLAA